MLCFVELICFHSNTVRGGKPQTIDRRIDHPMPREGCLACVGTMQIGKRTLVKQHINEVHKVDSPKCRSYFISILLESCDCKL